MNSPRWLNTVTGDETGLTSQLGSIVRTLFTYNTNRNRTVNYPFCSPQQYLNNLQYQKTIKYGTRKSTLCTSWLFFASKYGISLKESVACKRESENSQVCGKRVNRGAGLGLDIPVIYKIKDTKKYLERLDYLIHSSETATMSLRRRTLQ